MDFKQLEAFVKVAELRSFSKAADALYISQPSVSHYVKKLETEFACELVDREAKGFALTHAGKIFYEKAKEMLALKSITESQMLLLNSNFNGEIRILASSVPSQYILPPLLAEFSAIYPEISFRIRQTESGKVAEGIGDGFGEIGFCGGIFPCEKSEFYEFFSDNMVVIAPKNTGFDSSNIFSLDDVFKKCDFVGRETGSGTKNEYENFFDTHGIDKSFLLSKFHFDNTQSIINAVISDAGVAVISEIAALSYANLGVLEIVKTEIELPKRKFYFVLKKNLKATSHLARLLANFITQKYNYPREDFYV